MGDPPASYRKPRLAGCSRLPARLLICTALLRRAFTICLAHPPWLNRKERSGCEMEHLRSGVDWANRISICLRGPKQMKFMTSWSVPMENIPDAVARFLSGEAPPPAGVTILGRWHNADLSGGFTLTECNDAVAAYADAAQWA